MRRLGASWWGLEVGPPHRHPAGISQDMGPPKSSPISVDVTLAGGLPVWDLCPERGGGSWWLKHEQTLETFKLLNSTNREDEDTPPNSPVRVHIPSFCTRIPSRPPGAHLTLRYSSPLPREAVDDCRSTGFCW